MHKMCDFIGLSWQPSVLNFQDANKSKWKLFCAFQSESQTFRVKCEHSMNFKLKCTHLTEINFCALALSPSKIGLLPLLSELTLRIIRYKGVVGSPNTGAKLEPCHGMGNQSWFWESQVPESTGDNGSTLTSNPWVESTEVRNREYQCLHKMVTCYRKKILKKER